MGKPVRFGGFTLYKIYYGDDVVYLGRTKQPLQDRLRGHFFKKPMCRAIDISLVTKVEYATFKTEADMFLYEIYYINRLHPPLNRDDRASDDLTVTLPEVEWHPFDTPLFPRWREEIAKADEADRIRRARRTEALMHGRELRRMNESGELSDAQYSAILAGNLAFDFHE